MREVELKREMTNEDALGKSSHGDCPCHGEEGVEEQGF
jgi:hypothetical protein